MPIFSSVGSRIVKLAITVKSLSYSFSDLKLPPLIFLSHTKQVN